MPQLFHGTKNAYATSMADDGKGKGTISVSRGGGEFGRGFYTQDKKANALVWAVNRFSSNSNPCVLEVEIPDATYLGMKIKLLDLKDAQKLTQKLRQKKTTNSHLEGVDVVVGPLNLNSHKEQEKFESSNSETILNDTNTTRTVI